MEIEDLSAGATLACLQQTVSSRRRSEVEDLELAAHWCDLHLFIDRPTPGCPMLVEIGGDGTPLVSDLSLCELGIARGVSTITARHHAADALDLRHRLPCTWQVVKVLGCEPWVARKVASMSRHLDQFRIGVVDAAVAEAIGGQSPARTLELCQAKIIEADPDLHTRRLAEQAQKRYVTLGRVDEHGLRHLIARVTAGDAHAISETVDLVADILAQDPAAHDLPADPPRDLLRSAAIGWLARPIELLTLLLGQPQPEQPPEPDIDHDADIPQNWPDPAGTPVPDPEPVPARTVSITDLYDAITHLDVDRLRPTATVYIHLSEDALVSGAGVARVEGLGPHTLPQLSQLLRHRRVVVKPVIDLTERVSTAAYEYPEAIKERIHLLHGGDAFPHATAATTTASRNPRRLDIDHPLGWTRDGPPDQTNSHTGQPLSRTSHRAKTHLAYRCTPLPDGRMLWHTPHGLTRVVGPDGTHAIEPTDDDASSPHLDTRRPRPPEAPSNGTG